MRWATCGAFVPRANDASSRSHDCRIPFRHCVVIVAINVICDYGSGLVASLDCEAFPASADLCRTFCSTRPIR
ncbi:hypothetical protein BC2230_30695 [Burkholderia cepacia]